MVPFEALGIYTLYMLTRILDVNVVVMPRFTAAHQTQARPLGTKESGGARMTWPAGHRNDDANAVVS